MERCEICAMRLAVVRVYYNEQEPAEPVRIEDADDKTMWLDRDGVPPQSQCAECASALIIREVAPDGE